MSKHRFVPALALAAGLAYPAAASASSVAGVKVKPTRIEYQPSDPAAADRIIIHGPASVWSTTAACTEGGVRPGHPRPTCGGYLYLRCPADKLPTCRLEWKDIERALQQQTTATFGQLNAPLRVRPDSEAPANPDEYTLNFGVIVGDISVCTKPDDWKCAATFFDAGAPSSDAAPADAPSTSNTGGTAGSTSTGGTAGSTSTGGTSGSTSAGGASGTTATGGTSGTSSTGGTSGASHDGCSYGGSTSAGGRALSLLAAAVVLTLRRRRRR